MTAMGESDGSGWGRELEMECMGSFLAAGEQSSGSLAGEAGKSFFFFLFSRREQLVQVYRQEK
jgi:hypothetical protein